jgi:hypothetical protein
MLIRADQQAQVSAALPPCRESGLRAGVWLALVVEFSGNSACPALVPGLLG